MTRFSMISAFRIAVVIAIDRSGVVGEDGPTHHGIFDLSYEPYPKPDYTGSERWCRTGSHAEMGFAAGAPSGDPLPEE